MDIRDTEGFVLDPHGRFGPKFRIYYDGELVTPYDPETEEGFPHPRQLEYLESQTMYTMYAGMRGSGKTLVSVFDNLFASYQVPGCETIFFRKTLNELRHTVIKEFLDLPEELRGHFTDSLVSPRLVIPIPGTGRESVIHFASINTYEAATKYQGRQFFRITVDEWGLLPYEWWAYVQGSLRSTVSKDREGYPVMAQMKGLSNPGGPGSDTLRRMFGADCEKHRPKDLDIEYDPKDYTFVRSNIDDNPMFREGTPAGDAYRKNLRSKPPALRAAWLEGKWTGHEGMFFDKFDEDRTKVPHDIVLRLMGQQYFMPIFLGIDVGLVHHSYVALCTTVVLPVVGGGKKTFYLTFDEIATKGMSEHALAGHILDKLHEYGDSMIPRIRKIFLSPETFGEASRTRARIIGDVFAANQLVRPTKALSEKHVRENGLRSMYNLLSAENTMVEPITYDEHGKACDWLISDKCELLLAALPWATSDPDKPGDILKEGDSVMLDVLDGTRYGIYSHRVTEQERPLGERQKERLISLAQANSPLTFTQKAYAEYINELKQSQKPDTSRVGDWARRRHKERV